VDILSFLKKQTQEATEPFVRGKVGRFLVKDKHCVHLPPAKIQDNLVQMINAVFQEHHPTGIHLNPK
jgi:hypothetical protein